MEFATYLKNTSDHRLARYIKSANRRVSKGRHRTREQRPALSAAVLESRSAP